MEVDGRIAFVAADHYSLAVVGLGATRGWPARRAWLELLTRAQLRVGCAAPTNPCARRSRRAGDRALRAADPSPRTKIVDKGAYTGRVGYTHPADAPGLGAWAKGVALSDPRDGPGGPLAPVAGAGWASRLNPAGAPWRARPTASGWTRPTAPAEGLACGSKGRSASGTKRPVQGGLESC